MNLMEISDYYNSIFKRKSIRKYKPDRFTEDRLIEIQTFIEKLEPLFPNYKYKISIFSNNEVKTILPIKSPYYISFYAEAKVDYLVNIGFLGQQLDLFLSSSGIGTCWLGLGTPQKAYASKDGMAFVITLVCGQPNEPLYRNNIAEFRRKNLDEITSLNRSKEILEAVRLAPSATNSQPWYFSGSSDKIIIQRKLPNFLKAPFYKKYNQIDMGIAIFHLKVATLHNGKKIELIKEDVTAPKGYEYILTANID